MSNLIFDLSDGEFHSLKDLHALPVSEHTVRLIGEFAALSAVRTLLPYHGVQMDRLYRALIKDMHHIHDCGYILSDGYDVAQTAICFLWQFNGRNVNEIYGISHNKSITILKACYRTLHKYLMQFRQKILQHRQTDVYHDKFGLSVTAAVQQYNEEDYEKLDNIMDTMKATKRQREVMDCYISGLRSKEIAEILCIHHSTVRHTLSDVRKRYAACFGSCRT